MLVRYLTGSLLALSIWSLATFTAGGAAASGQPSAPAPRIRVHLTQPTPGPESRFANQRDFYVTGSLSGKAFDQALNVQVELKDNRGRVVRQVQSQVDPLLETTAPADLNQNYYAPARGDWSHPWSPSKAVDLRLNPSPEMARDGRLAGSEQDPGRKAVVNGAREFAALVLGGASQNLPDLNYRYPQDLKDGQYQLSVKVLDLQGRVLAVTENYPLTFSNQASGNTNKMIIARFSPTRKDGVPHKEMVTALAKKQGLKIMFDLFPGYWSRPLQPWLGTQSVFAEYYPRWLVNDVIEYRDAPETLAVLYNIAGSSATQQELTYVNHWRYLDQPVSPAKNHRPDPVQPGKVFFYRYDIGDPQVTYAKNGRGSYTRQGKLVPFDGRQRSEGYKQLMFARAEITEPSATLFNPAGSQGASPALPALLTGPGPRVFTNGENLEVLHDLRVLPYNVDFNVYNDVHLKVGQRLSLLGVVTPLPAPVKFNAATGAGEPQNAIRFLRYNLITPRGDYLSFLRQVGLTRQYSPSWQAPSIYEFLHQLPEDVFISPGRYQVQAVALDSWYKEVPRTKTAFKVIVEK